jgi:hypothetical protein
MKIRLVPLIVLLKRQLLINRVIALSVAETDPASQTARAWRCNIFGDLFELVPEQDAQGLAQPMAQVTMKGTEPLVQTLRAPRGYKYRQLNDADTEVTVDVCGESPPVH